MDSYELSNGETIYPIANIEYNEKKYLFFKKIESIYVAEEFNDELLPVSEDVLPILLEKFKELKQE